MPPIDDALRSALSGRADRVTPGADPFAGIEQRARRIRRNRGLAAAVGTAAAVALVAVAVPALVGATTVSSQDSTSVATQGPTAPPLAAGRPAVLGEPWGRPALSDDLDLDAGVRQAWATAHKVSPTAVRGEQLLYASTPGNELRVGAYHLWAAGSDDAYEVVVQAPSRGGAPVLVTDAQVEGPPGLAVGVVAKTQPYVVAAAARPGLRALRYAKDGLRYEVPGEGGQAFFETAPDTQDVIGAVFSRSGPTGRLPDKVQGDFGEGGLVSVDVPPGAAEGPPDDTDVSRDDTDVPIPVDELPSPPADVDDVVAEPANLLSWPLRGDLSQGPDLDEAKEAFAAGLGGSVQELGFRPLLALSTDGGLRYVAGQAWLRDGPAHAVAYATGGECGPEPFIGRETPAGAKVLAFSPGCVPGRSTDSVFVVPAPETGQVQYGAEGSEYRDVAFLPGLEPVAEVDRDSAEQRGEDRIRVLDGNGNLDGPFLYEGPLQPLLCGLRGCG